MIRFEGVNKSFPDKELFKSITMTITSGMRVGLVGANGTGKTTLLKMILKEDGPDSGNITVDKGQRLGYLPQDIVSGSGKTILQEVLSAWPEIGGLEEEIYRVSQLISEDPHNNNLLNKLGQLQQRFEALDGWQLEDRAKKYLSGLGFTPQQFHHTMDTFSGGWRMRVALAGILIKQPDYLLLDEPTNHLDLDATIWLESFLHDWKGGLMMISHDRSFLDKSVNHILELERGKG
ncbi:MAG: ATP-binding cassette domain-containing protein, partial [Simkaniaceae bacterium]|nr:ATP-binding cassette domain-containing protein [Simkaniaceae bacterium]